MAGRFAGIFILWLAAWGPASGNDSALLAVGGAVRPMRGHPSVRMVSEEVRIRLPECDVDARFVFRNEGKPVTVLIGFPEQGVGEVYTELECFRSSVDGRRVRVRRLVQQRASDHPLGRYHYWWVKRVRFERGQTRVVRNRYRGGRLVTGYGQAGFSYILRTGAPWKGRIGRARIVCDARGLRGNAPLDCAGLPGVRKRGNVLTWELRDFEPDRDLEIWWPQGFLDVRIDGRPPGFFSTLGAVPVWKQGADGPYIPQRRGQEVWTSLRTAAAWLGAHLKVASGAHRIRLERGGVRVEARLGSRWLESRQGRLEMARPARRARHVMIASLNAIARGLGGQAEWDRYGRLQITLPPREAPVPAARSCGQGPPGSAGSSSTTWWSTAVRQGPDCIRGCARRRRWCRRRPRAAAAMRSRRQVR